VIARWSLPLRLIHWTTAALALVAIPAVFAAQALAEINTPLAERLAELHMACGIAILVLTLARLSLRLVIPAPPPPARPIWGRILVGAGTVAFYALLISLPLSGLLKLTLSGFDVDVFDVPILAAGAPLPEAARLLNRFHELAGLAFIAAALLHAMAALAHERLFGSPVLRRMA
jgi:cytochrome b561